MLTYLRLKLIELITSVKLFLRSTFKNAALDGKSDLADLRHPLFLPYLGSAIQLFFGEGLANIHRQMAKNFKRFGRVYRDKVMWMETINVVMPEDTLVVKEHEGRFPVRLDVPIWRHARDEIGISHGLTLDNGEQWYRMRSVVQKPMLNFAMVRSYAPKFHTIASEFTDLIYNTQQSSPGKTVCDIKHLLYRWSVESVCEFLFHKRLGCLDAAEDSELIDFPHTIGEMFTMTQRLIVIKPWLARFIMPFTYYRYMKAWRKIVAVAAKFGEARLREIEHDIREGREVKGVLSDVLQTDRLTAKEKMTMAVDLMIAGSDTTATAATWLLYHLARNQDKQERLYDEIVQLIGADGPVDEDFLTNCHYLKACLRESFRLSPVIFVHTRQLADGVTLSGHNVPKGTMVTIADYLMARSPDNYADPFEYLPERWVKGHELERETCKHGSNPFGFGSRMCIGRKVAEFEVFTLIATIVQRFRVECTNGPFLEPTTSIVMSPSEPVNLKLHPRCA